jgi:hypothetical protein
VQKLIRSIKEQNEGLKNVFGQRLQELKEMRPVDEFVHRSSDKKKKQFETIGDVE